MQDRRYDSDYRTVESLVEKGAFGEIHEVTVHYDWDLPAWVAGGGDKPYTPGSGMMFGIGCHKLDQVLHLFGAPETVTGFYRALRPGAGKSNLDDTFTILLHYDPSGPQANLEVVVKCNVINRMRVPFAYHVRGYKGSFVKFGEDPQEAQVYKGMTPKDAEFGYEDESIYGELCTETQVDQGQKKVNGMWLGKFRSLKGDWALYYADVAKAIKGGKQVVMAETSRDGIKIIELARKSADEGKTLPFA